ncbi:MAG: hypothetical protein ACI9HK_001931, partial [Pirellulaceae bacterium]
FNPTGTDEDLSNWELDGGISFTFSQNTMLPSGETLVVTSRDPADPVNANWLQQFRDFYSIDASVMVVGGYRRQLSNGGDRVTLLRAVDPPLDDPTVIPLLVEDEVDYDDAAPWPIHADGNGTSLRRVSESLWGNDPTSWSADGPTPGSTIVQLPTVVSAEANASSHALISAPFFTAPVDPADLQSGTQPSSWAKQQSYIHTLTITFSEPVNVELSDFAITNLGVNAPNDSDVVVDISGATMTQLSSVVQIHLPQGLIPEGVLRIDVPGSVSDYSGSLLDGDSNGTAGDSYSVAGSVANKIFQLTSEFSGDLGISVFDFSTFSYWFGESTVAAGGLAPEYADMNIDGGVSVFDFTRFSSNFGKAIVFPIAFAAAPVDLPGSREDVIREDKTSDGVQQSPAPDAVDSLLFELAKRGRSSKGRGYGGWHCV